MTEKNEQNSLPETPVWPFQIRLIVAVTWIIIGVVLIWLSRPVWYLAALAMIVAYLFQPLVDRMHRYHVPRALAALLLIFLLVFIISMSPLVLVPALFADVAPISIDFNGLLDQSLTRIYALPTTMPAITVLGFKLDLLPFYAEFLEYISNVESQIQIGMPDDLGAFLQDVISSTTRVVGTATAIATSVIGRVAGAIFSLLLLFLLTLYFTTDLPKLRGYVLKLAPATYQPEWSELWRRTGSIWNAFFRGQILLSIVVGTAVWLGLSILGVPGALVLGILAGVLEVIPNLGPVLAAIPAVVLALLQGSTNYPEVSVFTIALLTIALYVIIQQLENYVLVPRILGGSVGVHPALILIGVFVFTVQFGIIGAFIATPTIATIIEWFKFYHARMLNRYPYPELLEERDESPMQIHDPPGEITHSQSRHEGEQATTDSSSDVTEAHGDDKPSTAPSDESSVEA